MKPILLFDVNETLLSLASLDAPFMRIFGDPTVKSAWFTQMLQLSFVGAITNEYLDFTSAQRAALQMLADRRGVKLSTTASDEIIAAMSRLAAHPDVRESLDRLATAGFRMATLTNSVQEVAQAQLLNAGIRGFFEAVLSADQVGRLKPAPEPYLWAAETLGIEVSDICLIAAHAWDVSGALAAGCQAAFIARAGAVPSPVGRRPTFVSGDLADLTESLVEVSSGSSN